MNRYRVAALGAFVVVVVVLLAQFGFFGFEHWTRDNPLSNPIAVSLVQDGVVRLVNGQSFRPAGVRARTGISAKQLDEALRVMTAQGVVIDRDLGDGRAFFTVEPKFYNWCGTRGFNGLWWSHWAGGYFPCPLSPLLIHAGYAELALEEEGLSPKERRRLEGAEHLPERHGGPMAISTDRRSLRFDGSVSWFQHLDELLEDQQPPPLN